ncbi:MAG TPA: hypothetical protein VIL94_03660 [Acidothermaceae bacterium]|jgi:hypothetical protein
MLSVTGVAAAADVAADALLADDDFLLDEHAVASRTDPVATAATPTRQARE